MKKLYYKDYFLGKIEENIFNKIRGTIRAKSDYYTINDSAKCYLDIERIKMNLVDILFSLIINNLLTTKKSIFARFPMHYHILPPFIRGRLYELLTKFNNKNLINDIKKFNLFIPANKCIKNQKKDTKNIITIDVDSKYGYKKLDSLLKIFIAKKNKIIVFIPSSGYDYSDSHLENLIADGIEIGCHGFDHSGKFPFDNDRVFNYKIEEMKKFRDRFNIKKYRAPAYIHTKKSLYAIMNIFKEDWSFRDIYFENGVKGTFYSDYIMYNNCKFVFNNIFSDALLYYSGLHENEMFGVIRKKINYLKQNAIDRVFTFHSEPHFSGNRIAYVEKFVNIIGE